MHNQDEAVSKNIVQLGENLYYQDSVTVIIKGLQLELVKIMTIFTSIDFLPNHFEGPIPIELMDFKELHILNLLNSVFSDEISSLIGNLEQLESLALSQNSLSGEISIQLASLPFLSYLNLSFNCLRGKIPTGTQLQTFSASSFEGNDGLYGPPLTENPPGGKKREVPPQQECERLACTIDWNFISVELGLIFGPLLIWKQWRLSQYSSSTMKIVQVLALLVIPFWLCLCNHVFVVSGLCLDDQKFLLLQLKNKLTFTSETSNKLNSWKASNDCCWWMGVTCDSEGHVTVLDLSGEFINGGLIDNSSSLFSLQHLQYLNLAENFFYSEFPSGFSKLENLTYLNLSRAGFMGQIPIEISQLTRLVTLDISSDFTVPQVKLENPNLQKLVKNLTNIRQFFLDGVTVSGHKWCTTLLSLHDLQELSMSGCNLSGPLDPSLARLENLSVIVLDQNNLSSPVPQTFAHFKNLTILSLKDCGLTGTFPQKIFNIGTLSHIDISSNVNLHGFFPDFPFGGSLQTLRVSKTRFSGAFPHSIGSMRNLSVLDLSYCGFDGTVPNSLSNLTALSYLDLSNNNFTGPMTSFGMAKNLTTLYISNNDLSGIISSSHFEGLYNLVSIDLSYNSFTGTIPSSLFTLPSLRNLLLSDNEFIQLDEFINVTSSKLENLDISNNNLCGPFPVSIFQLNSLFFLSLSSNKFSDPPPSNANMLALPDILFLHLASCNLKTFPDFLKNQSSLFSLDLSDNQINGTVPAWIWKIDNLDELNISHNLLTGLEGSLWNLTSSMSVIDLHCNKLQGPISVLARYFDFSDFTNFIYLSNNALHGSIPDSVCNASYLQVLDLSMNNLSGRIPSCLMRMSETLQVLNLKNNHLSGHIPNTVPAFCGLWTLNLHGNLLDGPIPNSLAFCKNLEVLDLGSNQFAGGFPCFLKEISRLRVLVLRNNEFQGPIRCSEASKTWQMLQIVDIAFNHFSGKLPGKCFRTWKRFIINNTDKDEPKFIEKPLKSIGTYYQDSVTIISKGLQMELVKILTIFTSMDFSSNHFEGPIPDELMNFKELHILNLSNNALFGEIPSSIDNLRQLESLDLSQNSLSGEIPMQLASLSFLSYLNLSFNHLVGKIPTGTQLQSFSASSFKGNNGLYGLPLTKNLADGKRREVPPQQEYERLACTVDWNFISVELGLVFGHGIIFGPLLIWKRWRIWYWQLVHKILCWIFPQLYLEYVNRRGQTYATLRWMQR